MSSGPPGSDTSVTAVNDVENGLVTVTVRGPWDRDRRRATTRWLDKAFAEHPAGVIIELVGMTDPELTSLPTWLAARRTGAGLEPPVDVVLCVPPGDLARRLDRMGAGRFLRAFPSTSEARAAVLGRQIVTDRLLRRFPARPGTLAEARRLVTGACTAWGTPELGGNATLVISELAANAVEHAASDFVVLIARRPDGVHIAVCDDDPRMPRMPAHADGPLHLRGRGLRLIETLSSTWGAMPTATGKVVWATLRRP